MKRTACLTLISLGLLALPTTANAGCTMTNDGRTICSGAVERDVHVVNRKHRASHREVVDANGNGIGLVVSHKTGATAHVSPKYAAQFQAYIDDLESGGAVVRFIGGYRRGHCWSGGLHPCGKALDVCQLSRGRVDPRCHLPGRTQIAAIAERHGLFEGGQWCSSDYGHAQVGVTASACGNNVYSAMRHHTRYAKRTHTQ